MQFDMFVILKIIVYYYYSLKVFVGVLFLKPMRFEIDVSVTAWIEIVGSGAVSFTINKIFHVLLVGDTWGDLGSEMHTFIIIRGYYY